jgi:2-dehydro-3-deoxyphosphogalactonate aldolase
MNDPLARHFADLPLIAILRGVTPAEAPAIGTALVEAGFRIVEVPLNSPEPLASICGLVAAIGERATVGAGTVLSAAEVEAVAASGARLVVSPNTDAAVIRAAKAAGLATAPGVATPTEAFAAISAGADLLKLFPAETLGPATLKAWRAVLPRDTPLVPVGGVTPENVAAWRAAGAAGLGLGSAIYSPGMTAAEVGSRARAFVAAWEQNTTSGEGEAGRVAAVRSRTALPGR